MCVSIGSLYLLDINIRYITTFGGLFILGLATGSIKPNLSAFAADQVSDLGFNVAVFKRL